MKVLCFLCRHFFKGRFKDLKYLLWKLVWRYDLSRVLCRYLLPNGSCGKNRGMTRQKLEQFFKTQGVEIVRGALDAHRKIEVGSKIELVGRSGEKVGEIKVIKVERR